MVSFIRITLPYASLELSVNAQHPNIKKYFFKSSFYQTTLKIIQNPNPFPLPFFTKIPPTPNPTEQQNQTKSNLMRSALTPLVPNQLPTTDNLTNSKEPNDLRSDDTALVDLRFGHAPDTREYSVRVHRGG